VGKRNKKSRGVNNDSKVSQKDNEVVEYGDGGGLLHQPLRSRSRRRAGGGGETTTAPSIFGIVD